MSTAAVFTAHCLLSFAYFSMPTATSHCLLPTVYCPLFTATVYCPLFTAHCLLCLMPTVHCPLFTAHSQPTAYCPLFTSLSPLCSAHCPHATVQCPWSIALYTMHAASPLQLLTRRLFVKNNLDLHSTDTDSVSAADRQSKVNNGQWTVNSWQWKVGSGQLTVDS